MTEAETLRQCVACTVCFKRHDAAFYGQCGEPIAQMRETWEHVDPEGPCGVCGREPMLVEEVPFAGPPTTRLTYLCQYQSDSPDHGPPVVQRGHQAIPR